MLDIVQELESYLPINLDSLTEKAAGIPDNIRNSIILYNKALDSIRMGSEDIAIIELKKAVSMNPDFCEAMNLLGICYCYIHDQDRATEMFQRVIRVENNSIRALSYIDMLNSGECTGQGSNRARKQAKRPAKKLEKPSASGSTTSLFAGLRTSFKSDIVKYVIGFAVGALILLLIMLPMTGGNDIAASGLIPENTSAADSGTDRSTESGQVTDEENERLQGELAAVNTQLEYYSKVIRLFEIESLLSQKKTLEAADGLLLFASDELKGPEKDKLDALYDAVMPGAAIQVYNEGKKLYDTKNYTAAVEKLEKVTRYWEESDKADEALYFLGRSYKELNESRKALEAFQSLVDSFPNSTYSKQYAPYWIDWLKGQP